MSDRCPDLTQRVVGYRHWIVKDGRLCPAAARAQPPWRPGANEARCATELAQALHATKRERPKSMDPKLIGAHDAPHPDCFCGLYAYHAPELSDYGHHGQENPAVLGAVVGWGRIAVHKDGWRAQHAEVVALACERGDERIIEAAARYGVPVVHPVELPEVAAEHGSPVPVQMRPAPPDHGLWNERWLRVRRVFALEVLAAALVVLGAWEWKAGAGVVMFWFAVLYVFLEWCDADQKRGDIAHDYKRARRLWGQGVT